MSEDPQHERADRSGVRFEVTVHRGSTAGADDQGRADLPSLAGLDLDRVPDPDGGFRCLADLADCVRLVERGFEVRLLRAVPIRPLDPGLVRSDEDAQAWLADRLRPVERTGER